MTRLACLVLAVLLAGGPARAGEGCAAPSGWSGFALPLPHAAAALAAHGRLTIVALGSSSTFGTGASAPRFAYPARLERRLEALLPGAGIRVLNRGVPGEEADQMIGRFGRDVLPARPDLVIWQLGTNAIVQDRPIAGLPARIEAAVARLKAAGTDVVLMDPQYAPMVLARRSHDEVVGDVERAAAAERVDLFPRFALMRHWVEAGQFSLGSMLAPDGLHMNDRSYACLADTLAGALVGALAPRAFSRRAPRSS